MTTYRLPEALGGGEVRIDTSPTASPHKGFVRVLVESDDETFPIEVPRSALVEVKPPLPPEPVEPRTLVWTGEKNGRGGCWEKSASGDWYAMGDPERHSWQEVCSYGPPILLVPDPFAEPVEFPWVHTDPEGYGMFVGYSQRIWAAARVGQGDHCADLTAEACRDMARALWAIADHGPEATS